MFAARYRACRKVGTAALCRRAAMAAQSRRSTRHARQLPDPSSARNPPPLEDPSIPQFPSPFLFAASSDRRAPLSAMINARSRALLLARLAAAQAQRESTGGLVVAGCAAWSSASGPWRDQAGAEQFASDWARRRPDGNPPEHSRHCDGPPHSRRLGAPAAAGGGGRCSARDRVCGCRRAARDRGRRGERPAAAPCRALPLCAAACARAQAAPPAVRRHPRPPPRTNPQPRAGGAAPPLPLSGAPAALDERGLTNNPLDYDPITNEHTAAMTLARKLGMEAYEAGR